MFGFVILSVGSQMNRQDVNGAFAIPAASVPVWQCVGRMYLFLGLSAHRCGEC
jgi:hypothetical protein